MSAILAAGIGTLCPTAVSAAQVLEVPQLIAAASTPRHSATRVDDAVTEPGPEYAVATPEGVGSLDEYESQHTSAHPVLGSLSTAAPVDPKANRSEMGNSILVGALILGVLAMELHATQQHR